MIRRWRMELIVVLVFVLLLALDANQRLRPSAATRATQALQLPPPPAPLPPLASVGQPDFGAFIPPPEQLISEASPAEPSQQALTELALANGRLRLVAVSITPEGPVALLHEEQQNGSLREPHHLRPGDTLHGYQVLAIKRHAIRLQGASHEFELLLFERK